MSKAGSLSTCPPPLVCGSSGTGRLETGSIPGANCAAGRAMGCAGLSHTADSTLPPNKLNTHSTVPGGQVSCARRGWHTSRGSSVEEPPPAPPKPAFCGQHIACLSTNACACTANPAGLKPAVPLENDAISNLRGVLRFRAQAAAGTGKIRLKKNFYSINSYWGSLRSGRLRLRLGTSAVSTRAPADVFLAPSFERRSASSFPSSPRCP